MSDYEFRARTIVRIEKQDAHGVVGYLNGWNWRKRVRLAGLPLVLFESGREDDVFYSYANVNLRAESAKDLNHYWCE